MIVYILAAIYARRVLQCFSVVVLVLLTGCASLQDRAGVEVNLQSDVKSSFKHAASVLLLEPQIDYTLQSFSYDPVSLPIENSQIRDTLFNVLADRLSVRGLHVVNQSDLLVLPDKIFLTRRVIGNYQQLMALRNFSDDPLPSLGPMVNRLSAPENSELLLISRYSGTQKSPAQQHKDKFTTTMRALVSLGTSQYRVSPAHYGELEVALIDGVSGQVIWSGFTPGQPSRLALMVERILATLPTTAF